MKTELKIDTLKKYASSELLERDHEDGEAIYMHSATCLSYCDFACNGQHGFDIANDINEMEGRIQPIT